MKSKGRLVYKTFWILLIILIIAVAFKLLIIGIKKPFWGHHDWNSVVYSKVARNYIRYGYIKTKLGQVTNSDYQSPDSFGYITHYPPLLPIFISFSFKIFGQTEAAARLVTIFFSLVLVISIYLLGKEIHSKLLGIFAALSVVLTPLFLYFGKLPVHDTIVPAISTFGFWAYVKFIKERKRKYIALLVLSLVIGGLVNWSAFYLVAALVFHQLISKYPKKVRKTIFTLIPLSIIIFAIFVVHIHFLGVKTASIYSNLIERINPYLTSDLYGFTLFKYVKQELLFLRVYYTMPVFLGAVVFPLLFLYKLIKKQLVFAQSIISALFVYGILQLIVFEQLSFIHDYMIYYLLPYMILSFSYILIIFIHKFRKSIIYPLILIALVLYIFFDKLDYTKALINTSMHKRGYDVAEIIKKETLSKEKAFISSNSYKEFEDVFVTYYADRDVAYGEELPENFENKFKLIIRPKDHDPLDTVSKKLLDSQYQRFENNDFIWYKIY